MNTKRCPRCGETKVLTDFYKNKTMADGRQIYCKTCWSAAAKAKADAESPADKEARLARRRETYHEGSNGRKAKARVYAAKTESKDKRAAYAKTERGKEVKHVANQRYWGKDERTKANSAVSHAVRTGKLPPAKTLTCAHCGAPAVEYHHPSYAPEHRLVVIPLCKTCHAKTYTNPVQ